METSTQQGREKSKQLPNLSRSSIQQSTTEQQKQAQSKQK